MQRRYTTSKYANTWKTTIVHHNERHNILCKADVEWNILKWYMHCDIWLNTQTKLYILVLFTHCSSMRLYICGAWALSSVICDRRHSIDIWYALVSRLYYRPDVAVVSQKVQITHVTTMHGTTKATILGYTPYRRNVCNAWHGKDYCIQPIDIIV